MIVSTVQSTGGITSFLWLPLCPLVLNRVAFHVLGSLRAVGQDVLRLKSQIYNFKRA